jgi:hypothetical protein
MRLPRIIYLLLVSRAYISPQASKDDHELVAELFEKLPEWLERGPVKPNRPKVLEGLGAVADGFQEYRDGKISAYKIVYKL